MKRAAAICCLGTLISGQPHPRPHQLSGVTGQAADKTFEWDAENRLIAVKVNAGTVLVRYAYDHASRRSEGASTTLYVYDAWNCVAEIKLGERASCPPRR